MDPLRPFEPRIAELKIPPYATDQPPSTRILAPVMREAAGEARKTTRAGNIDGIADAPKGNMREHLLTDREPASAGAVPSVDMNVGETLLTVIP